MSRPRSAGSVFWGLILITAGLILLLKNLGYDIPVWTGVARYWPILLIIWGCVKLVDYARWKRAGQPGPLFGAGEVVLLIIVILSGSALTAAANMSPDLGALFEIANIDLWDITGNSYPYSEHYERDVPNKVTIEIINRYGNVDVTPGDTDRIVVDVAKTVIARNEAEAEGLSKVLMYSIVEDGGRYRVISNFNRDQNSVRGRRFKTSLTVRVPRQSSLTINNRNGSVSVSGLTGDQQVSNAFGNAVLKNISGEVKIENRNDGVLVEDITGATAITNEFGKVEVRRLTGTLDVRNRNGGVETQDVKGDAKLSAAFGSVDANNIQGNLSIDARNASVEVTGVDKDVSVEDRFESIRLVDVKGGVRVDNQHGSIELRYTQPPRNNIQVNSRFGDVSLSVPSNSAFSVDAKTRHSPVSTNFTELSSEHAGELDTLKGQIGSGGPQVRIENENGSIRIEK